MGPTILTMPSGSAASSPRPAGVWMTTWNSFSLDPQWRCFFSDGSVLDLARRRGDGGRLGGFLAAIGLGRRIPSLPELSARLNAISERFFFWRSVGSLRDISTRGT